MIENTIHVLFSILRAELKGEKLSESEKGLFTDETVSEILNVAQKHDIAHLVCSGLLNNQLLPDNAQKYQTSLYKALYRYEKQNYELNRIRELLNSCGIPFIVLKGSVLRQYYREPWLRTSCDIDILVKKDDLIRTENAIIRELEYEHRDNSTHDISLLSSDGFCVELHFELNESDFTVLPILSDIWNDREVAQISKFEYGMSNELFLLYHIYHMAKHFMNGGCGIRPFMDLWVVKNKMGYDSAKVQAILKECGLSVFGENALLLSDVWFSDAQHTELTKEMEQYIIGAGSYGTMENKVAISQAKKGGKLKYALGRIFQSYPMLKIYYPRLEKYPILFPYYQVKRWCRILFTKNSKRAFSELKCNSSISEAKKSRIVTLCNDLELL